MVRHSGPAPELARWLLDASAGVPSADALRAANLAAYAYAALPAHHPARAALRGDFLAARARHQRIKAELIPLVQAWNAAGIEPLFFKGFYLAELVYPIPGMRFHGDVDVLVPVGEAAHASEIAQRKGWEEAYNSARAGRPYFHGVCSLFGPGGATCVDLHRWVLHSHTRFNHVQRRVTDAVWSAAAVREWEGARIRVCAPADALLVALVLQRCWGDRWHLKTHDVLDFRYLSASVPREALHARARELGVERTLTIFLDRCDPGAGRLKLGAPRRGEVRRWNRAVAVERGLLAGYLPRVARLLWAPRALLMVALGLPSILAARRALRKHREVGAILHALEPAGVRPRSSMQRRDLRISGVLRGVRWMPRNAGGDCLLRALALCHMLWREGWPARFVSGIRREKDGVLGHAWVELGGRALPGLGGGSARVLYHVNFEYPPSDAERPDTVRAV